MVREDLLKARKTGRRSQPCDDLGKHIPGSQDQPVQKQFFRNGGKKVTVARASKMMGTVVKKT